MSELSVLFSSAGCVSCALYIGLRRFLGIKPHKAAVSADRYDEAFAAGRWILLGLIAISAALLVAEFC